MKHGKYIPGVNIPIVGKEKISKKQAECVLVLAWNFFNEIKKQNEKISNNFVNIKDLENSKFTPKQHLSSGLN